MPGWFQTLQVSPMSLVIILLTILFSYGLGYLQFVSMLDLYSWLLSQLQEGVHPVTFSPNDLVNLACHNLERANLVAALQYVTPLHGVQGFVVRDWLEDARFTLVM